MHTANPAFNLEDYFSSQKQLLAILSEYLPLDFSGATAKKKD